MRSLGSQTIKSQIILMIRNNDLDPKKARKQSGGKKKRGRREIHLEEKTEGKFDGFTVWRNGKRLRLVDWRSFV